MFEHYTLGMQAQPIRRRSRELSPREVAGPAEQYEHSQCPSPPLSETAATPSARNRQGAKSAPDSIDRLAQVLSRQNLQLDRANLEQLQLQLSSPSSSPAMGCTSPIPTCPELEIDDEPQPPLESPHRRRGAPSLSPILSPTLMEVDQRPAVADMKRLSRQRSSQFNNNPNNSRTIQTLVEGMIASGSQCNVHPVSPPPLTPTRLGPILEPDEGIELEVDCMDLQIDDAYVNGRTSDTEKEEMLLIETMTSLRRAAAPAGVRKVGFLQYRASADAALSCANVVRNRPRMRKRTKMHRGSRASSSMVSSTFSSPVIPPSLADEPLIHFRPL